MKINRLGILAALPDEIRDLLADMPPGTTTHRIGMREFHEGVLYGQPCVIALTRVGKAASAATTTLLLREFGVDQVIFTGVAGGVSPTVRIGDIVVTDHLVQHDLDASPLFPRYEVPLLQTTRFATSQPLTLMLNACAELYAGERKQAGLSDPAVHRGLVLTGDRFISTPDALYELRNAFPDALCVEMEGAAVAQVCHEFDVPCAVMRTISDRADHAAALDFTTFLRDVASVYSAGILRKLLETLAARHAA